MMVRTVYGWRNGREIEIEVEGIKSRKTWNRGRLDSTDLIKIPISFGRGMCPFFSLTLPFVGKPLAR